MNFKHSYNQSDFLEFIKDFLPSFDKDIRDVNLSNSYKAIKNAFMLGKCDELDLTIFELKIEGKAEKKVYQAKEGFKLMKEYQTYKTLAVYYSEEDQNWRLSLMQMTPDRSDSGKIVQKFSNPRRYSFYLGPDAKTKTPEKFLKDKAKDFDDLIDRFDVEIVTKEFFAHYKKLYLELLEKFTSDHAFKAFAEKNNILIEIFTKKILGQIVFLYFLQRKGWLGADKNEHISKGDSNFLRNLFNKSNDFNKNFYNDYLEPLFYDCLNKKPEMAASFYRSEFDCQIPFLNGGLFEPLNNYKWREEFVNIPDEIFSNNNKGGILDIFDLYNFTVDENTPDDQEVSVDPEMLGKVFENLIDDNIRKGQGAFYTPREIVHYMCRESLVNYLSSNSSVTKKQLNKIFSLIDADETKREATALFEGDTDKVEELLKDIKVCDPACGSGAFLIGMLNEIVNLRMLLRLFFPENLEKKSIYQMKKEAIQNCLYGVDIDPGAVDIAKLRFWLSIVVDEEIDDIEPLPNLDYKLMQGNSLLENLVIGDSEISFDFNGNNKFDRRTKEMKNLFEKERQIKLIVDKSETLTEKLEKLHTEYFNTHESDKKKRLKTEIDSVENDLIISKCQEEIDTLDSQIKNNPRDEKLLSKNTEKILSIKSVVNKWKQDKLRPFFPWKLHFGEVFNKNKSGFDVVVANPPYIDSETMVNEGQRSLRCYIQNKYSWCKGNWDIYIAFFELSFNLLNSGGTSCYISPDKWIAKPFGDYLRKGLYNYIYQIIETGRGVFQSAKVDSILTFFHKTKTEHLEVFKFDGKNFYEINEISKESIEEPYRLDFLFSNNINLIFKIESPNLKISDLGLCENACATSDAYKLKPLLDNLATNYNPSDHFKVVNTGTISKYYSRWGISEMTYLGNKYLCPIVDKETFHNKFNNSYYRKTKKIKLIVKGLNLLDAFFDKNSEFIPGKSTLIITSDNEKYLKIILSVINSKIAQFYLKEKYPASSYNQGTTFTKDMINNLPIPKNIVNNQKLISKIDKIISIVNSKSFYKDDNSQDQINTVREEINYLIYGLYNLSSEEIKIIEESVK